MVITYKNEKNVKEEIGTFITISLPRMIII